MVSAGFFLVAAALEISGMYEIIRGHTVLGAREVGSGLLAAIASAVALGGAIK